MKEWLAGLEPRERIMVYVAAVVVVLLLVYLLLLRPFHVGHDRLKAGVADQRETVQWMQQSAARVKQLQRSTSSTSGGLGGRSLLSATDAAARAAGLGPSLKKVEPDGSQGVRVWLDGAKFDDMVGWLNVMGTRYGADVDTITIERAASPGLVNARLNLQIPKS
jgi:general secretion pathway protein M